MPGVQISTIRTPETGYETIGQERVLNGENLYGSRGTRAGEFPRSCRFVHYKLLLTFKEKGDGLGFWRNCAVPFDGV